jgi:hypothetical protein
VHSDIDKAGIHPFVWGAFLSQDKPQQMPQTKYPVRVDHKYTPVVERQVARRIVFIVKFDFHIQLPPAPIPQS